MDKGTAPFYPYPPESKVTHTVCHLTAARQNIVVDHHVDGLVLSDGGAGFAEGGRGTGVEVTVGPLLLRWEKFGGDSVK